MALSDQQPQRLLCAVVHRSFPLLELWLTRGRGTSGDPLRVELLGELVREAVPEAQRALEELVDRHGPNLSIDLSRATALDEAGTVMLADLDRRVAGRGGTLTLDPLLELDALAMGQEGEAVGTVSGDGATTGSSAVVLLPDVVGADGTTTRVLQLSGELDSDCADEVYAGIWAHVSDWHGPVVVEMGRVTFIDSTIISRFVRLQSETVDTSTTISLRNPTQQVQRVLEITGLLGALVSD